MKLIFLGSSGFSVPFLRSIYGSTHDILKIVTGPDKKKGRGRKVRPNPVKEYALKNNLDVISLDRFDKENIRSINSLQFDFALVVSFGKMIPVELLNNNKFINIHPSDLPKYRGPSPIESTLLNGEASTATTIIKVTQNMDAGDILSQLYFGISPDENKESLEEKHIIFGRGLLLDTLELLEKNRLTSIVQDEEKATFTRLFQKADYKIEWNAGAYDVVKKIRAFGKEPGAFSHFKEKRIKILKASISETPKGYFKGDIKNGEVVTADKKSGLLVQSGDHLVEILSLKPQGGNEIDYIDFINGYNIKKEDQFY